MSKSVLYHRLMNMPCIKSSLAVLCASVALASISIRRAGWLDRVVQYQKKRFLDDLTKIPAINLKARIERPPPGYVDSKDWDYDSVVRLLSLIRDSEGAKSVRAALHHAMKSNRRFMSIGMSFKVFPSLAKDSLHNFYYNADSGEFYTDVEPNIINKELDDDDLILVQNPVEAKLPNARISIQLLRSILENRAQVARSMSTTKKIIPWSPISTKSTIPQEPSTSEANLNNAVQETTTLEVPSSNSTNSTITTVAEIK